MVTREAVAPKRVHSQWAGDAPNEHGFSAEVLTSVTLQGSIIWGRESYAAADTFSSRGKAITLPGTCTCTEMASSWSSGTWTTSSP